MPTLLPTIVADFNTLQIDPQRVMLGTVGTPNGDRLAGMRSGDRVLLDGGDLVVEGTLEFDKDQQTWYARPDWSTRHDIAE